MTDKKKQQQETTNVVSLADRVQERIDAEAEQYPDQTEEQKSSTGGPDDPRFVQQCLGNNERGDGILFAAMHGDKFLHTKSNATWLKWDTHHWTSDKMNECMAAVEQVALKYAALVELLNETIGDLRVKKAAADEKAKTCNDDGDGAGELEATAQANNYSNKISKLVDERKTITKRINRLRTVRGAKNCLEWSHNIERPLAIIGDEIDRKPMLLPCKNGVIDLKTGQMVDGHPGDYLVKSVPVEFPTGPEVDHYLATGEGFQGHSFLKFISEIHQEIQELTDFVHRLLGYSITGLRTEHFIACFLGDGANGKGTLFELLHDVLGELCWSIEPEMILDQKTAKSSAGPSPDIISLYGRRLVLASETEKNRRISTAKVKRLTGGDTLTGRAPHDRFEINFKPTHKMFLITNDQPRGLASDFAMFRRLLYLWYPLRYVDDPEHHKQLDPQNAELFRKKDPNLPEKLAQEKPWILAWLVRGCLLWQAEGLNPPARLRAAAEEIRRQEDNLGRFIENTCQRVDADQCMPFADFYEHFAKWFEENVDESTRYRPSKKAIADDMRRKGYSLPPAKETGGTLKIYGLDIIGRNFGGA